MDIVQSAYETYVNNDSEIERRSRIIERHTKKIDAIKRNNWWGDVILRPIMDAVEEKYNDFSWDTERFTPMGLRNAVSVFGKKTFNDKEILVMLRFTPNGEAVNLDVKPEFNTHGFGSVAKEVESIEDVFDYIEKDMLEK